MFRTIAIAAATLFGCAACNGSSVTSSDYAGLGGTYVTVTPSGDSHTVIAPSAPQQIASGDTKSFSVTAAPGYAVSTTVGGTCPAGSWFSSVYQTAPVTANCTVTFSTAAAIFEVSASGTNVNVTPPAVATAAGGSTQSFTVVADDGYSVATDVNGTCPAGSWSGTTYTTGTIDANCTVQFSGSLIYYAVTPVNGNTTTTPAVAQSTRWNTTQAFTVVANQGFALSPTVAGTCPPGSWSGDVYTTGAVNGNCTVVFNATDSLVVVTATGDGNVTAAPGWVETVSAGQTANFTLSPNAGWTVDPNVTGTCPAGTWSGAVYTTGPVNANCTVGFSSEPFTPLVTVIDGNTQTLPEQWYLSYDSNFPFEVQANQNFTLVLQAGGSCPPGSWTTNVYTPGNITENCNLIFTANPTLLTATATATYATIVTPASVTTGQGYPASFTVNPNTDFMLSNTVSGSCPAGTWDGNIYHTGGLNGNCTVVFSGVPIAPTIANPALYTTSISPGPGSGNVTLAMQWEAASDPLTSASNLNYQLCASGEDPSYGSFATAAQVLANPAACTPMFGITEGSVVVNANHAYYVNVVVTDSNSGQSVYQPKGESASSALAVYIPFEGNSNDIVGGYDLTPARYQSVNANAAAWASDRFANANNAVSFASDLNQCLSSNVALNPNLVGTKSRTLTFWSKSGLAGGSASPANISGGGNLITNGQFGLYHGMPSGNSNWNAWLYGTQDVVTSSTYYDNSAWQFWAVTFGTDGTVVISAYLNGNRVGQNSSWTAPSPNTTLAPLFVGCGVDGSTAGTPGSMKVFFDGEVDDIRLFEATLCDGTGSNGCTGPTNDILNLYNVTKP